MTLTICQLIEYKLRTISWENHTENVHQKLVQDPFLILVNKPKHPLPAKYSFKSTLFWNRIIRKP